MGEILMLNSKSFYAVSLLALALVVGSCSSVSSSIVIETSSTTSTSVVDSSSFSSSEVSDERYQIYLLALNAGFTGTYQDWLDSIRGADGTSILSGNNDPTGDVGRNGDVYVNTTSWDFFVKVGGVWTKVGNIMGPKGDKGEPGQDGRDGTDGQDGNHGMSAYQIYLTYYPGYPGTEFDWINDLASGQLVKIITYDFNGGTESDTRTIYFKGESIGILPTTMKAFHMFLDWTVEGEIIDEDYYVISNSVIIAQWEIAIENGSTKIFNALDLMNILSFGADYYILANDIDLAGIEWTPLGNENTGFSGYLDGNGKTISNLTITQSQPHLGLFAHNTGTVKNLKLENVHIDVIGQESSPVIAGSLVAINKGNIENIETLSGSIIVHSKLVDGSYVGGIVGLHNHNSALSKLNNSINVVTENVEYSGGLVGAGKSIITNSINKGSVSGDFYQGGLVGGGYSLTISNSMNIATITGGGVGGLIGGAAGNNTMITNSLNKGALVGEFYSGGLVGWGNTTLIVSSMNIGTVSGSVYLGGLIGRVSTSSELHVQNSVNFADILSTAETNTIGGITGIIPTTNDFELTFHTGRITINGIETLGNEFGTKIIDLSTFNLTFFTTTLGWDTEVWDFVGLDVINGVYPTLKILPTMET
jgi:hypothetical protein